MSEELLNASKGRIQELLQPVNGGVGEDISYDEKFEQIKTETEKLASLTGERCDWSSVAVHSEELLQEKSKDFRVACYFATCKLRQGSLEGALDGLVLLDELTKKWWDEMYPPIRRLRARAGMVGWMSDQAGPALMDYKPRAADSNLVKAIDELSQALDNNFRDKFADQYTGMVKLRDAIRHLVRSCPKEAPKPAAPPPQQAQGSAAPSAGASAGGAPAAVAPAPVVEVTDAASAMRAIDATGKSLVRIAQSLRAQKPENEQAYRLSRVGMWLNLQNAPPATGGKTIVPPPPPNIKQRLETLVSSQDWLVLLNEAENHAGTFILWIDLHRYVSTAMSALGALFMKAKKEVLTEVALMLNRVPALATLAFADGTPFADAPTQMWIDNEVKSVIGSGGGGGGGRVASALDEPIKEARELAVKGELAKAVALVSNAAKAAPTPADRFRGKLAAAQLCLGAGQLAVARGQLEALTADIERHQLMAWDPALCAELYSALFTAIRGMNAERPAIGPGGQPLPPGAPKPIPPDELAAERAAFEKLCQLDPGEALKLAGKKG
ncbi:MAG TPA: type VI secretion system protein TssA [Polyangiaceae bacterium]|jgi:type VI secretion system protein VasJ|nr:type VI secretion system protein TssA [Polyangiaceae bacterium]